jgi:hypothetical protein
MNDDIISLENMLSNISINNFDEDTNPEKEYSKDLLTSVFRHIIAFSLAFTRQNANIAFREPEVLRIYNILNGYLSHVSMEENILTIPFLPCLFNDCSTLFATIIEFQNSYGFIKYIKRHNIIKTYFKHASHFLLEYFCSPCDFDFFQNWTQEQLQILYNLVEYIYINWNDIGGDADYDYDFHNFYFLLYNMQIAIE